MKDFIDTTSAILIMGFIIWVVTKIGTTLRGHFYSKNTSTNTEKRETTSPNSGKSGIFLRRKKTLLIVVVIVVCLIIGWKLYDQSQKREAACIEAVRYAGSRGYRIIRGGALTLLEIRMEGRRYFKTQSEAMDYCLKVLK